MSRKFVAFDDLAEADGQEVRADQTAVVGLALGGRWEALAELDLSDEHVAGLWNALRQYLEAGHTPLELPEMRLPRAAHSSPSPGSSDARQYGTQLRTWAKARKFLYSTPSGTYYYSDRLKLAFAHWLETGEEPAADAAARLRIKGHEQGADHASSNGAAHREVDAGHQPG